MKRTLPGMTDAGMTRHVRERAVHTGASIGYVLRARRGYARAFCFIAAARKGTFPHLRAEVTDFALPLRRGDVTTHHDAPWHRRSRWCRTRREAANGSPPSTRTSPRTAIWWRSPRLVARDAAGAFATRLSRTRRRKRRFARSGERCIARCASPRLTLQPPTSPSSTHRCSELIAKATVRVGVPIKWRGGEYGWISSWQHPTCLARNSRRRSTG